MEVLGCGKQVLGVLAAKTSGDYKHGYKLGQKNQRGASRALFARCSRVVRALLVRWCIPGSARTPLGQTR